MNAWRVGDFDVRVDLEGARRYVKVGAPVRFGRFCEIRTPTHVFHCGPDGTVRFVQGRGPSWPHPSDWLKRTARGDWVYYSAADYRGLPTLLGETLPAGHLPAVAALFGRHLPGFDERGAVYLSPLAGEAIGGSEAHRRLRALFRSIAPRIRLPTFLYLIQRL